MKVRVSKEQEANIQTLDNIKKCCGYDVVIAFDIILNNEVIGFAMFEKYTKRTYFLWDYAIDIKYQNKGYGTQALIELGDMLKREYCKKHNIKLVIIPYWDEDIIDYDYIMKLAGY